MNMPSTLGDKKKQPISHFDQNDWASAYCNVEQELTNIELKATRGEIPKELKGTFYRNGPGPVQWCPKSRKRFFDTK